MKKIMIFLIFVLGIALESLGQGGPIKPYNENGYTPEEIKNFSLSGSSLANSWRDNLLEIINSALSKAGKDLVLDDRHISWIFDHVHYEMVTLSNFTNSRRSGSGMEFFVDRNVFNGEVGVFEYDGVRIILFKTICLNLLKITPDIPLQKLPIERKEGKVPIEPPKEDFIPPQSIESSFFGPSSIEAPPSVELNLPKQKSGLKPWQKTLIAGAATTLVAYATYKVANNWDNWFKSAPSNTGGPQDGQPNGGVKKSAPTQSLPVKYEFGVSIPIFH